MKASSPSPATPGQWNTSGSWPMIPASVGPTGSSLISISKRASSSATRAQAAGARTRSGSPAGTAERCTKRPRPRRPPPAGPRLRDGNGRISRITQSLVLAREGLLSAEFASIEDCLGQHTPDYYRVLQEVQGGSYRPERDATPWVVFCIQAHLAQARFRLEQIEQAGRRWSHFGQLAKARGWPDRLVIALEQALIGGTDRGRYKI